MRDKKTILIIHEERKENERINSILKRAGYSAISVLNSKDAVTEASETLPDVILICKETSSVDSITLLRTLRKLFDYPIIVLSESSNEDSIVESLDNGAYDYFVTPFGTNEHIARIRATLRHLSVWRDDFKTVGVFSVGGLTVDYTTRTVSVDGDVIHLTPIEFRIISLLTRNAGRVLKHEQIISEIWGPDNSDNLVLRVNMANIRRKIESDPSTPKYILTEMGVGYKVASPTLEMLTRPK